MSARANCQLSEPMNRTFASLWVIGALTSVTRWLELLATSIVAFDLTGSPFQVALLTLVRMAPLSLFGIPMGAFAERADRRLLFTVALVIMVFCSLAVATLVREDDLQLWHLAVAAFLSGCLWVFDFAVRRPMIGESVKAESLGRAMGLDTISNNGTRMIGPLAGGTLLQVVGLDGAYMLAAVVYVLCACAVLTLPEGDNNRIRQRRSMWSEIRQGFQAVSEHRLLKAILSVTIAYNLFGFPVISMTAVVGRDSFGLEPALVGALASAEGAGALIGGIFIAAGIGVGMASLRRCYFYGLAINFSASLAFAMLLKPQMAAIALLVSGIGAAGFSSMQTTLLVLNTPPELRARVMGLLSVCIGTALIGFLSIGLLARQFGAETAIILSSLGGLGTLTLIWVVWPEIVGVQKTPTETRPSASGDRP